MTIKNVLKMVGIWILVLALALLVLEGIFRLFREHDPLKDVRQTQAQTLMKPGLSFHSLSSVPGEFDYTAQINRDGYRGADILSPKPVGTLRILAVGDSFTFGVGSPDDQTIPFLLEKDLKAKGYSVEVVNAGIGGEGTLQHYENIKRIHLKHQPDLVVLLFDLTDLWDDWYAEKHTVRDASGQYLL